MNFFIFNFFLKNILKLTPSQVYLYGITVLAAPCMLTWKKEATASLHVATSTGLAAAPSVARQPCLHAYGRMGHPVLCSFPAAPARVLPI